MRLFVFSLIASLFFVGSVVLADEGSSDSLEGRTQLGVSGYASYGTLDSFYWSASADGIYYLSPHFGLGAVAYIQGQNSSYPGLWYGVGPQFEYFFPVADRHHLFTQASVTVSGAEKSTSSLNLGAKLGYRYFVSDDIALTTKFSQVWQKPNSGGATFDRLGGLELQLGFSLFF